MKGDYLLDSDMRLRRPNTANPVVHKRYTYNTVNLNAYGTTRAFSLDESPGDTDWERLFYFHSASLCGGISNFEYYRNLR